MDEIWTFIGMNYKQVPANKRGTLDYGDAWTWTAIDADTMLVPSWLVGHRDSALCESLCLRTHPEAQKLVCSGKFFRSFNLPIRTSEGLVRTNQRLSAFQRLLLFRVSVYWSDT